MSCCMSLPGAGETPGRGGSALVPMRLPGPSAIAIAAIPSKVMNSSRSKRGYRTVPLGLPMGAVGCVLVPLVLLPGAAVLPADVLPVLARSCCRHVSRSAPIMFWQRLRPPTAAGGATGAGVTTGDCEGVTAGVCEGLTAGVSEGVAIGGWPGEVLGAVDGGVPGLCAKAVPARARRTAVLRVFNMTAPFIRFE